MAVRRGCARPARSTDLLCADAGDELLDDALLGKQADARDKHDAWDGQLNRGGSWRAPVPFMTDVPDSRKGLAALFLTSSDSPVSADSSHATSAPRTCRMSARRRS